MMTVNDGLSGQVAIGRVEAKPERAKFPITPEVQQELERLLKETGQYLAQQDLEKIRRAFELANWAHRGVLRRSGEPYILHPLEVALLLADMRIDADGIAAALLHDVVEDTDYTLDDLSEQFGPAIASIVDGVTKFDALAGSNGARAGRSSAPTLSTGDASNGSVKPEEAAVVRTPEMKRRQRTETVRKMMLAMAEDPRVVVLKLADRLHNMRTLNAMNPVQQQNTARETMEIYAPLARRLGIALVQAELEDLAFSYLEPEKYARLEREVKEELRRRQPYIDEICRALNEEMERAGIPAEVSFRPKHLASIYRKLQQNGGELSQVHDIVSFRILVDTEQDCYLALGHIHALWRPKDGRIKDFIATPKLNGYQSLHTTVFGLDNQLAEIQIRTHDMQRTADYGVASYWYLKERGGSRLSYREMVAWIEQLRDWQRELPQSADEFVEAVKGDIFQEQIFVFTPKGEVKDLPRGSTPLDMAYRIHTDIGDHCAGARIITNLEDTGRLVTRLVPLDYELKGGEIVDIVTNGAVHPTRDWLSFARTAAARNKIRRYLKTYEREINLQLGQERLDIALKAAGASGLQAVEKQDFAPFTAQRKYPTVEDVYVALGREDLAVEGVVEKLLPVLRRREEEKAQRDGPQELKALPAQVEGVLYHKQGLVKLAHCCCPLPGDAIVGYLHPNRGMFVHRSECRVIRRYREQRRPLVEVNWLQLEPQSYVAPIQITASDRAGLLRDVAAVVADAGINMTAVSSTTHASLQKAVITAKLEIETVDQLELILKRLRLIRNVTDVKRSV